MNFALFFLVALHRMLILQSHNFGQSTFLDFLRNIIRVFTGRKGPGPLRVRKHVGRIKTNHLHQRQGFAMILFGFPAESNNDIGGNCTIREYPSNRLYPFQIPGAIVGPVHARQNLGTPGLHR